MSRVTTFPNSIVTAIVNSVGIFTAYVHTPTEGFILLILIAKINIYMTFTLIIYISTNQNLVNVTMYCYRHVIYNFSYYMYSRMCNPTEQESHTSTSVDGHDTVIQGKHWSHRRNNAERNKWYILTHLGETGYCLQLNPNYKVN